MKSGAETVGHSRLLPLEDCDHQLLQIRKDGGDIVTTSPVPASFPSAFAPLLVSVTSSQSSRNSPCPTGSASPCLRPEIATGTREEWNTARPSDRGQGKPQGTENEARMDSVPSIAQPQSRWFQKEPEEVKPARRGQEQPGGRKSRARHLTGKEKAATKINRRAREYAKREARAARAAEANEKREALAAEVDRGQRLWLEARRRRAGVPDKLVVVHKRAVPYKPTRTGSKSAPDQRFETEPRRLPGQDLSQEKENGGWPETDETEVPHKPAVPYKAAILYKPAGSGAKSAPGQQLVIVPQLPRQDLSEETYDEGRPNTDEAVIPSSKPVVPAILYKPPGSGAKSAPGQRLVIVPRQELSEERDDEGWPDTYETVIPSTSKAEFPAILYKPPGSGAKSAPGQRLVIVPRRLSQQDLSDETDEDDWSDIDETMSSVAREKLEEEQGRMLQHELCGQKTMQEGLSWSNGHEPMQIAPGQDHEIQYKRAQDSYNLGKKSSLELGEETEEEDWSNINPKTLLPPCIPTNFG